ncbi:DUF559 domain-containing protein [Mumia flava]|uniref:DUF559 domain-containing protein n=1 Tax=Mumia flava TaxID=1348852 RepID=UPI0012FD1686|nr:DUF559 domain-containing protein [Mumia flava]
MRPLPEAVNQPFRSDAAHELGITPRQLDGKRFRRLFRGVHVAASVAVTFRTWLQAALLVLPADAAISHLTALRMWGLELRGMHPLHFSTNTQAHRERDGIVLHRRRGRLRPVTLDGFPCLGPDRTYVDCATILNLVELVQAADHLLYAGHTSADQLRAYLHRTHIDGVVRARRAFPYARERAESPMETLIRLSLVLARLPEPDVNPDVLDGRGRFLGRCDLVYWKHRVVVEYDGEWHERSRRQRARDRTRRENLERAGWTVIVVLVEDLLDKRAIAWRVFHALRDNGYAGPPPHFNTMWQRWFGKCTRPAAPPAPPI